MPIRETVVNKDGGKHPKFPEHKLAHELLDGLTGIELGAAAHNPFGLQGSTHVSPGDDLETFRQAEIDMCGAYAEIDIVAEADAIPVEDDSQDYIISSHVFEHLPNPVKALQEWGRIVKDGGFIFMIVPQRDALKSDEVRPLTTEDDWIWASGGVTVDTWNELRPDDPVHRRGHYHVYTPESLAGLMEYFWHKVDDRQPWLELVAREDRDTKVGNGFTLVYRVHKPQGDVAEPITEEEAAALPEAQFEIDGVVTDAAGVGDRLMQAAAELVDEVEPFDGRPVLVGPEGVIPAVTEPTLIQVNPDEKLMWDEEAAREAADKRTAKKTRGGNKKQS